jgi:hypothetical protein
MHNDAISAKWLQKWKDLQNPLHGAGYCLDPEFHSHDHRLCTGFERPLLYVCKVHGAGSAESAISCPGPGHIAMAAESPNRRGSHFG